MESAKKQHKMKRSDAFIVKYGTWISNYKKKSNRLVRFNGDALF